MKASVKNAIMIGMMCFFSYLAVYLARNILGAISPQIIESGVFTTEQIGEISSIYFITYAAGQLINGAIGDKVKAKYMLSIGLIMAGVCNVLFSALSDDHYLACVVYGMTGYFLSMIYAPMTKTIAENTEPVYTARCSLGYTFASFLGTPMAGVLAMFFTWKGTFCISSVVLCIMGSLCFLAFSILEKKGIIQYPRHQEAKEKGGGIRILIKNQIVKFTIISIITGIVRTSVVFWLPTYFAQYLGYTAERSAFIYTMATFVISLTTFVALFLYERLNRNMDLTIFTCFVLSAISFLIVFYLRNPVWNVFFIIVAIMSSNAVMTMYVSVYCPSLKDTGMVSSATGFLDFASYVAAAVSSTVFANAVSVIGWGNLILVWFGLMIFGVIVSLPRKINSI